MLDFSKCLFKLSLILCMVLSSLCYAAEFQKKTSFDLSNLSGELVGLKADKSQPFLLFRVQQGLNQNFWVVDLSDSFDLISLAEITNVDNALAAQWSHGKALFPSADSVVVFDPKKKQQLTLKPSMPTGNVFMDWSNKYNHLIYQTQVLPSVTTKDQTQQPAHALQTGLAVANDESFFVTSGFHDQSIRFWSLPGGKLLKSIELGGWFSSSKVSSLVMFSEGIAFISNQKALKWLANGSHKVKSSFQVCDSETQLYSLNSQQSNIALYSCFEDGRYGLVHQDKAQLLTLDPLGKISPKTDLISAHIIHNDTLALLIFDLGKIRLYDIATKQLLVEQTFTDAVEIAYLESTGDLATLNTEKSLQLWSLNNLPTKIK